MKKDMQLDIFTLAIISIIVNVLQVVVIHVNALLNRKIQGTVQWLIGYVCIAVGSLLVILRAFISIKLVTIILGNGLVLFGLIILYSGIMRFFNKKGNRWVIFLTVSLWTLIILYFTYVRDDLILRSAFASGFLAFILLTTAWEVFRNRSHTSKLSVSVLAAAFLIDGLYFTARLIIYLASTVSSDYFEPSILQSGMYLVTITFILLSTFGLINMVNQKLSTELKASNEYFERMFNTSPEANVITRLSDGVILNINQGFEDLSGYTNEELMAKSVLELNLYESPADRQIIVAKLLEKGYCKNEETTFRRKDGSIFTGLMSAKVTILNDVPHIFSSIRDITERKLTEKALAESEERFRNIFDIENDALFVIDKETGAILEANTAASKVYGYTHDELLQLKSTDMSAEPEQTKKAERTMQEPHLTIPLRHHKRKDGTIFTVELSANLFTLNRRPALLVVSRDITDRKQAEENLLYQSYHDYLTGLYNRRIFEIELKRLDTKRNLPISIAMGDVNGLKLINDSFGHGVGDELLQKVAEVIKKACRADDIIARLGGDEFAVIFPQTDAAETELIIARIKDLLSQEKAGFLDISISFGFEIKTDTEEDIQIVLKNAEDHMYRHKLHESMSMRSNTIDLVMKTLFEKSKREMLHSKRVSETCEKIAIGLGLESDSIKDLKTAGLMHDIGKIGVADQILNKPTKLNSDEWEEIKKHPEIGYRILSSVKEFSELADHVLEHHERWDGQGYPRGLKGEEILLEARVIAVADAYDAMTNYRTYVEMTSEEQAVKEIRRCAGTQFDPAVARVFIEKVLDKRWEPENSTIK
jgi:diguanylate cyclase (GGDEF)-like protein/PAS domain S-box-containing protein